MDLVSIGIEFQWRELGDITLDAAGKLLFPKTENSPGLYRFDIFYGGKQAVYIGETEKLQRRLQHYRTPGKSQQTNLRVQGTLVAAIQDGNNATVSIVTDGIIAKLDHREHPIELARKFDRTLLEHAAILKVHVAKLAIINV